MICFNTTILKFAEKGEKTGWTYILIPNEISQQINPEQKKSYRVKGKLDNFVFSGLNLLPMGDGDFILSLNADIRKAIKKIQGDKIKVELAYDNSEYQLDSDLIECLQDDAKAKTYFFSLAKSHQNYFSKWIQSAKTTQTKAKRITIALNAFSKKMNYAEMIRNAKTLN
jgi:hypothetical protein